MITNEGSGYLMSAANKNPKKRKIKEVDYDKEESSSEEEPEEKDEEDDEEEEDGGEVDGDAEGEGLCCVMQAGVCARDGFLLAVHL